MTRRRIGAALIAATLLGARPLDAHPIHTTLTVITVDAGGRALTLNIRAFADDFSATVAKFAGKRAPRDSSAAADDVVHYIAAQYAVTNSSGASIALESCGIRRANELYWLCFRAPLPSGTAGVKVRNQMLTELHADQVNIVQLERGADRRTFLFTKASAPASLDIR